MKLERILIFVAVIALIVSAPISMALSKRSKQLKFERKKKDSLQFKVDTIKQKLEESDKKQREIQKQNEELKKQLEAKIRRQNWLATLEFPVGGAPAWKVRDALAFYMDRGLTELAASYLVGNLVAESSLDETNTTGDGGVAWGVAQWHPSRRYDMPAGFHDQLAFVLSEMQRSRPRAYELITNNPGHAEAASAMKIFEGYGVEGPRYEHARYILNRI